MKAQIERSQTDNELVYEELVTVIEASQGTLALLIAVCDDSKLRDSIIQRYEEDLSPLFKAYRLQLAKEEPSLRASLGSWTEQQGQSDLSTVLTVTGAEDLLWFKIKEDSASRTEVEKFFGYLQWGREGLREFQYPIVLWITPRILKNLSLKAPDFWSWRKGVFWFVLDKVSEPFVLNHNRDIPLSFSESDSFLLPPEDLQELIAATEQREGTEASLLGTLYGRLAQVYQHRIERGEAKNIQEERSLAIENYKKAIALQTKLHQDSALIDTLEDLGRFHSSQGKFKEAILLFQQSLQMARTIGDRNNEAYSLVGLGHAYDDLGEYVKAIEFHEQSLAIQRDIGDRQGEAAPLSGLGNAYYALGEYAQAIEFHEQSLAIQRDISDRQGEAASIANLGNAYFSLGQYAQALEFYKQSLAIKREIGACNDEANSIMNLGNVYFSLGQYLQAIEFYEQSLIINRKIGDLKGEADVWCNLGNVLAHAARSSDAIDAYRNARQLYAEMELDVHVQDCDNALQRLSSPPELLHRDYIL
jgi:tetratricopeptide (TPR) repeat protein